jgi:hypothetical protein
MALILAILPGIVVGLLLGGRIGRLADLRLRSLWLFYAAIGLQLVAYPSIIMPYALPDRAATTLQVLSYAALVAITMINRRLPGMVIAGVGMLSNLAAILLNGGHMPALPAAMRAAGLTFTGVDNNSVADAAPTAPWLVDRFAAPHWLPGANIYSVGDILIVLGVIVLVAAGMGARLPFLRRAAGSQLDRRPHRGSPVELQLALYHEMRRRGHVEVRDQQRPPVDRDPKDHGPARLAADR